MLPHEDEPIKMEVGTNSLFDIVFNPLLKQVGQKGKKAERQVGSVHVGMFLNTPTNSLHLFILSYHPVSIIVFIVILMTNQYVHVSIYYCLLME